MHRIVIDSLAKLTRRATKRRNPWPQAARRRGPRKGSTYHFHVRHDSHGLGGTTERRRWRRLPRVGKRASTLVQELALTFRVPARANINDAFEIDFVIKLPRVCLKERGRYVPPRAS
jgi:hypothetical protein